MNWYVRLKGNKYELNCLSKLFITDEVRIKLEDHEQENYVLSSSELNDLLDPSEVINKGKELIKKINGIGNLSINFYNNVSCDSVFRIDEDGVKSGTSFFATAQLIGRSFASAKAIVIRDGQEIHDTEDMNQPIQFKWVTLNDDNVRTVINLLSNGLDNWVNLYRIFEIVEGDLGQKISDIGWVLAKSRDLFKHTANSPSVLGEDARHGWSKQSPPPSPMELSDAKKMITSVVINWLNKKTRDLG